MTLEVTVVDPLHPYQAQGTTRSPWSRQERLLAVVIGLVLLVGVVATRTLRAAASFGTTATPINVTTVIGERGSIQVDLAFTTDGTVPLRVRSITADRGWTAVRLPPQTGNGIPFSLQHDVTCSGQLRLPSRLRVAVDGSPLLVPVRAGSVRLPDSCDPFPSPLHAVSTSVVREGDRAEVSVELVNVSTHDVAVTGIRAGGFSFTGTAPLPVRLPGRSRNGPLVVAELDAQLLRVVADVTQCGEVRAGLDNAVGSGHPDLLAVQVAGKEQQVEVPGIEAYLEQQWRAACVR